MEYIILHTILGIIGLIVFVWFYFFYKEEGEKQKT